MREMLSPTGAIMGRGLGDKVALITDGRFSGGSHGFVVGHITPEAATGGPIAAIEDGDEIEIDARRRELALGVDAAELERRLARWQPARRRKARERARQVRPAGQLRSRRLGGYVVPQGPLKPT
jgi:dihydroxy-acid dehydratase